ncbi:MAG: peptide-methionine (S)-S-oxide reductase MsrA [Chloroflexi bacterium]|nr:peptide-methionine (S)-S-oxide reductase MsrA [Chloroflexota bacterium]
MSEKEEIVTLGGGCFWCVEAVFQELNGVNAIVSGYAGGNVENPTYRQICTGTTGHAEVAQITFDPEQISLADILTVFWSTHDPTTLNRQGADVGTQYRSVIFYHDEKQQQIAVQSKAEIGASGLWPNPIVTEISPLPTFYVAEEYHQNYYRQNGNQSYCQFVINPKMSKFRKAFRDKLK